MPAKTWNQLLEELENFKAKVASLEQEYATSQEQSQKEILFLKEKIAGQNTKVAALDMAVAGQDKKIVVLETTQDQGHKEALFLKAENANQDTKIAALEMAVAGQDKKIVILETNHEQGHKETIFLKEKIVALENAHDKDMERLALEAAYDRQRVAKLEQKEPQPLQKDRGEILIALIADQWRQDAGQVRSP